VTATRNITTLLFDDVEVLDFCGPFEVFSVANHQSEAAVLNVVTVAEQTPIKAGHGLSVNPDYILGTEPTSDLLLVPGGLGSRKQIKNSRLIDWIRRSSDQAELVMSVCTGALLLGQAGLLNGLDTTTHHVAYDLLRDIAHEATVHEDRRFIDNGKIVTSAGITAVIDMSLHVVGRPLGEKIALATARHMEYPWRPE